MKSINLLFVSIISIGSSAAYSFPQLQLLARLKSEQSNNPYQLHLTGRNLNNGRACYLHVDSQNRVIQFSSDKTNMSIRAVTFATIPNDIEINNPQNLKLFVSNVIPSFLGDTNTADLVRTHNKLKISQVTESKLKLNCEYDLAYNSTLPFMSDNCEDQFIKSKEASCRFQSNLLGSNIEITRANFNLVKTDELRCVRGGKVKFFTGYGIEGSNGNFYSDDYDYNDSGRSMRATWLSSEATSEGVKNNSSTLYKDSDLTYDKSNGTAEFKSIYRIHHLFKADTQYHIRATCQK